MTSWIPDRPATPIVEFYFERVVVRGKFLIADRLRRAMAAFSRSTKPRQFDDGLFTTSEAITPDFTNAALALKTGAGHCRTPLT